MTPRVPRLALRGLAEYDEELRGAERSDDDFSLDGREFTAKVVSVYDGDTLRLKLRYNGEIQQHNVRLLGINSPEMKPRLNTPNRTLVVASAVAARDALIGMLPVDGMVRIECSTGGKYGRLLARIYVGPTCINDAMIRHGHAVAYEC